MESVPTISVEKTDGCQMYLGKGIKPEIITAKSSEMNVIIPTDGDDYVSKSAFLLADCQSQPEFEYVLNLHVLFFLHSFYIFRWNSLYLNNSKLSLLEQN